MKKLSGEKGVVLAARRFVAERGLALSDGEYLPATPARLKENGMGPDTNNGPALVIRYCDVKGTPTDFYRVRSLDDRVVVPHPGKLTARERAERRYWQPGGTSPRAYFPRKFNFSEFFSLPVRERALTITEGEFKADAAAKHTIACIGLGGCWNYRVSKKHPVTKEKSVELLPELARLPLQDMEVHIAFDSDAATNTDVLRARDDLAERLEALGARIFIRKLPQLERGAKTGLDDFLKHKGKKAFLELPLERWYSPNVPQLVARKKDDFLNHEYKQREEILRSEAGCLLRHPSILQIHAFRGVGKSQIAAWLAGTLAHKGSEFLRWRAVRSLRVLYVDGEQLGEDGQEIVRLQAQQAPSQNFYYLNLEDQPMFRIPKIVTPEGRAALERVVEEHRIEVLVLDSLSTLANVAMNDEENQLTIGDWFVRLRTGLRVTVIYLQHDGKTGEQRGHSKHEDWIDLSIHLKWPSSDYHGAEGLRAHFSIDKARKPIADGQSMKISFGPSLKDPRHSEWMFAPLTKEEETHGNVVNEAALMLFRDSKMSDTKLIEALRAKGFKGKNERLRKVIERARELRAKNDAPGDKKEKL
jgi:hypothetical protein